jgi:hypothetical protein
MGVPLVYRLDEQLRPSHRELLAPSGNTSQVAPPAAALPSSCGERPRRIRVYKQVARPLFLNTPSISSSSRWMASRRTPG